MRATLLAAVLSCVALATCQPDLWAASSETVGTWTESLAAQPQLQLQQAAGDGDTGPFWHRAAGYAHAVSRRQLLQGSGGGILSNVDICIRVGNQIALRRVSAVVWRLISSTGLARRRACALTGTGAHVCEGWQRSADNRACVCKLSHVCDTNTLVGAVNPCSSIPCQNGGTCFGSVAAGISSYTCSCRPGWTGTNCENTDYCALSPCQNGGTCFSGSTGYTCSCRPGWSGTNCQNITVTCGSLPCQHGGTCFGGSNGYTCSCRPGWTGTNCEINIDGCAPNPCQNGGTCTDTTYGFTCSNCSLGYVGSLCQQPQSCWSQMDQGEGAQGRQGSGFVCAVLRGVGSVSCWGSSTSGANIPPPGLTGVQMISCGMTTCVVLSPGGTVQCWGSNTMGETNVPAGLAGVTSIDVTYTSTLCAVYGSGGSIKCWGSNSYGKATPPADLPPVNMLGLGYYFSCALLVGGTVSCWGDSSNVGSNPGLTNVTAISAGYQHLCALKIDTTVVCVGSNLSGQRNVPAGLTGVLAISAGEFHTCALTGKGAVVCWGGGMTVPPGLIPAGQQAIQLSTTSVGSSTCVTLSDSTIRCFGTAYTSDGSTAVVTVPLTCPP